MEQKTATRLAVYEFIRETWGAEPEYLWARYPNYAIFRHTDNQKWFALLMDVPRVKLGLDLDEGTRADILNVKVTDPLLRDELLHQPGYLPGYHISSGGWVSVLLDGTVPMREVQSLLEKSHIATASGKTRAKNRPPREWLVPANPAYWDIEHAFDHTDEISWKQSSDIHVGDTVYLYVGAPVSAILYQCTAVKVNIPYDYQDADLTIRKIMQLRLVRRYAPRQFTFDTLKNDYGVRAVRGPRGVPNRLSVALNAKPEKG